MRISLGGQRGRPAPEERRWSCGSLGPIECGACWGLELRYSWLLRGGLIYLRLSEARGAPNCTQAYAGAKTSAESTLVDALKADPEPGRIETAYSVTCGELRRRGQLR